MEALIVKNVVLHKDKDKVEDLYVELGKSHSWLKKELRFYEKRVRGRGAELTVANEKLTKLSFQLAAAKQLCNQAWSDGYTQRLERMRGHMAVNPQDDPEALDLGTFTPDREDLASLNSLGWDLILNVFSTLASHPWV